MSANGKGRWKYWDNFKKRANINDILNDMR